MSWRIGSAARGFLAGAAAIAPMSAVFAVAKVLGAIGELPPPKAVGALSPHLKEPVKTPVAIGAHILVGAIAGAAYGAIVPRRARGPITGIAAGLAVWLAGYEILMPAVTGMPKAHRDDRQRALTILIAHVVYGAALGSVTAAERKLRRR
jgi:hypothetical protein